MRLLLSIYDLTVFGGTERMLINLSMLFAQHGIDVTILSFFRQNKPARFVLPPELNVIYFSDYPPQNRISKALTLLKINFKLHAFFNSFDFIISNDYDKNKNTRFLKIIHGNFANTYSKCKVLHLFDTLIVPSSQELNSYRLKSQAQIRVIPNFLSKFPKQKAKLDQKIVLSVGRLSAEKGFLRLIDIWAIVQKEGRYSDWQLHIVGDGNLRDALQAKIDTLSLSSSIILKPFTNEIEDIYLGASLYAMTSHHEGLPMVLLESASFGLPAVAFDILTGPREVINAAGKSNDLLIKDGDLETFAKSLQRLMDDKELRKEMGRRAKQTIEEYFGPEAVFTLWAEVLKIDNARNCV